MSRELPSGTVTFLFTDVEGSTKLLHELGTDAYAQALTEHRGVLRDTFNALCGIEVDIQGDAFFFAFRTAPPALAAAAEASERLGRGRIRVRIGIHTGTPLLTEEGYVGVDVHRAARIAACGHGGQVLVSAATAALAGTDGLRDLGTHRLKDLSAPERIYQLGEGEFPPLKSLHQTNLPIPATPFLGREKELAEILALISRDDVRLLTLTGPGGTGKTRLGAQAAGAVAERYPHGVWWLPLAPLRDPALVVESAAQTLGAQDGLADHIADKATLLLFDNFEQVIGAASDLANLLASCPNLDILVTSREPLHVSGEQEYAVPAFVHEEGVGFFLARARAVNPKFDVDDSVSQICRRLDDLPLALELAAARVKALSSQQILERLEQRLPLLAGGARDLPERQRTLRATIKWSYELLTAEERRLFSRLAVFRGGCTLDAAEEVANADVDGLLSLVDKSLLRYSHERYWMLETIGEYATERLEESGEAEEVGRRHADYFVAVAEEADANYRGGAKEWLDALAVEHDNFRAALDRLETKEETQLVLQLAGALWRFWAIRGHAAEGLRRLERAIGTDERPTSARARALNGSSALALEFAELGPARQRSEEALRIYEQHGDHWGIANSVLILGNLDAQEGKNESARSLFEDALQRFQKLGDDHYTLLALRVLAWMNYELGDIPRARALHEEVVRRARDAGNRRMEQTSLGALAEYALYERRVDVALPLLQRAYEINREIGEFRETAVNVCRFARALAVAGRPNEAVRLLGTAQALHDSVGATVYPFVAEMNEGTLAMIRPHVEEPAFANAFEAGRRLTAEQAVALALDTLA